MNPLRIAALVGTTLTMLCLFVGAVLCFKPFVVPSASMENTVLAGDRIFVERVTIVLSREPKFGNVVAMRYPLNRTEVFIKRIEGIPGDRLRLVNKQLYRNGTAVAEPYAKHVSSYVDAYRDNFPSVPAIPLSGAALEMLKDDVKDGELVVPAGKYFVLGDNRDDSSDSRYWGFISKSDIIGRPVLVYFSYGEDYRQSPPVAKVRWERLFKPIV